MINDYSLQETFSELESRVEELRGLLVLWTGKPAHSLYDQVLDKLADIDDATQDLCEKVEEF